MWVTMVHAFLPRHSKDLLFLENNLCYKEQHKHTLC